MMESILGVSIEVRDSNGETLSNRDGYLGRLEEGDYRIMIRISPDVKGYHAFVVDGKGNVTEKRNEIPDKEGQGFVKKVAVRFNPVSGDSYPASSPMQNNIRLLGVWENGGFAIWEVSLIGQAGNFFLCVHQYESGLSYCDDKMGVVTPRLKRWPQMEKWVADLHEDASFLPDISKYVPEEASSLEGLADDEGRVQWFSFYNGVGCVISKKGPARVYWREIEPRGFLAYLLPGEKVTFERIKSVRNDGESRPTGFQHELFGVRVAA